MELFVFRIILALSFLLAACRWGDWKHWHRYYPTVLFVMAVNLSAVYLTYCHPLWNYSHDIFITTEAVVELVNTYLNLPATAFIYLSHFPPQGKIQKILYVGMWVAIYGTLEFIDHYVFGGIFYTNGWSWPHSMVFDIIMFAIIRVHHLSPWKGWLFSFIVAALIVFQFGFVTKEMK